MVAFGSSDEERMDDGLEMERRVKLQEQQQEQQQQRERRGLWQQRNGEGWGGGRKLRKHTIKSTWLRSRRFTAALLDAAAGAKVGVDPLEAVSAAAAPAAAAVVPQMLADLVLAAHAPHGGADVHVIDGLDPRFCTRGSSLLT